MKGTVIQLEDGSKYKCRTWRLMAYAGRDPKTGRKRRVTKTFHGTFREAEAKLADIVADIERQELLNPSKETLESYSESWYERRAASGDFAPMTLKKYRCHITSLNHVMGKALIKELTFRDIEKAYADMRAGDSPSGKPLSGTYVACCHATLTQILDDAVRSDIIRKNPAKDARVPANDTKERNALSTEDLMGFIASLDHSNKNHVAVLIMATMGLRRGEACGLDWDDIDFENKVMSIRRSYDDEGNLKATKTKNSVRCIPIPDITLQALKTLLMASGKPYVFDAAPFGDRMLPHSLSTWWRRHRSEFGMDGYTLHELRHTFVTHLARSGVDVKTASMIAGHSTVKVTLDIYQHADLDDKVKAMALAGF